MYPAALACQTYLATLLTSRQLQLFYCTGSDDLVRDFFVPCLESASLYRRYATFTPNAGLAAVMRAGNQFTTLTRTPTQSSGFSP